jgi:hypothetical protein
MALLPIQIDSTQAQPGEVLELITQDGVPIALQAQQLSGADVAFTPSTPANWPVPPPATTGTALDTRAAQTSNLTAFNAAVLPAAASINFSTAAIQPVRSGRFLVTAEFTATISGAGNATLNLQADAVTQASSIVAAGGAGSVHVSVTQIIAVTRTATHTFTAQLSASAGTVTCAAGFCRISVVEL